MSSPQQRIAIIQGHPDSSTDHFCHGLAAAYAEGAQSAGHRVRLVDVGALQFACLRDPVAYYHQAVPEDLQKSQEAIQWADHLVIIFPLWMGTMPALLKGFLEQVLRPGFAYENRDGGLPVKKLSGRSARIIITMGMPALAYRFYFGAHGLRNLKRGILGFVGMAPVRSTLIGGIGAMPTQKRTQWLSTIEAMGRSAR